LDDLVYDPALLNYMLFSLLESLLEYDAAVIFFHDLVNKETVLTLHVPEGKSIFEHSVQEMEWLFIQELKAQSLEHKDLGPVMARCFEENTVKLSLIGQVTPDESGETYPYTPMAQQLFLNQESFLGAIGFYQCRIPGKTSPGSIPFKTFPFPLILKEITHLMKLRYLHSQAEMQGIQDDLTKLYNHRYFMKALDKEFQRAKRYGVDLSLGVVDIDHLRQLNEEWGHAAGDQILQWLGEKLLETFRTVDICARSSGEDIFILFPETLITHAQMACQRLYKALDEHPFLWQGQPLDITISIGLTSLHEGIGSPSALIHEAENALSLAKEMGCNRIEVSIRSD
jgi:diguanylate cyclase (GGDEF)-like protein